MGLLVGWCQWVCYGENRVKMGGKKKIRWNEMKWLHCTNIFLERDIIDHQCIFCGGGGKGKKDGRWWSSNNR